MLYDFRCDSCNAVFEVRRSLSDEKAEQCPECASMQTHKIIVQTPQIEVGWIRTLGLGHSGQISLSPVRSNALRGRIGVKHGENEVSL